jgi:plastocyanin
MRRTALLLAIFAVSVAGCGGDDSSSSSAAKTATPTPQNTGGGGTASSDTVQIKMQNIQFAPKEAKVKVGQKVIWTNDDTVGHNVVGGPIKSEVFNKGETFSYTPTKAGTISYVCTIHPGMDGKLTVTGS